MTRSCVGAWTVFLIVVAGWTTNLWGADPIILAGHSAPIRYATWSPDGTRLATAAEDRQILIWDAKSGRVVQRLAQELHSFGRPVWSGDGKRLMNSAGAGYMACVWDVATGEPVRKLLDYQNHPRTGWLNADGTQAILPCDDRTIGLWDVTSGELKVIGARGMGGVDRFAADARGVIGLGADRDTALVFDLKSGNVSHTLRGHGIFINAVAVTRDGALGATCANDGLVILWDLRTGQKKYEWHVQASWFHNVDFSDDGTRLISTDSDATFVWDAKTGDQVRSLNIKDSKRGALRGDGKLLATTDSLWVTIWDLETGKPVEEWKPAAPLDAEGQPQTPKPLAPTEATVRSVPMESESRRVLEQVRMLTASGKLREAIDALEPQVARSRALGWYDGHPQACRDLYELAELYHRVGDHAKASAIFVERVANFTRHFGPKSVHTGLVRGELVKSYLRGKSYENVIAEWENMFVEMPESDPSQRFIQMDVLTAYFATKNFEKLDSLAEQYLARARKSPQGDVSMRVQLAGVYARNGAADRGRVLLEGELIELRKKHGAESPEVIAKTEQLAQTCVNNFQPQIAMELYRDAIKLTETKYGVNHEEPLRLRSSLAWELYRLQKREEALERYADLVPLMKANLGPGNPHTLTAAANWALTLEDLGKFAEAEPIRREVMDETAKAIQDPQAAKLATARALLGANLHRQSKWADAEKVLAPALEARKKNEPDAWTTYDTASMLGDALLHQKKYKEAEPLLLDGYQGLQKTIRQIPTASYVHYYDSMRRLVALYDQTDRKNEADRLRRAIPPKSP